jgi:hypothetical protein
MTEMQGEHFPDQPVEATDSEPASLLTGHARIDDALRRLDGLDKQELTSHPDEFDAIHRVLRESLANAGRDGDVPDIA